VLIDAREPADLLVSATGTSSDVLVGFCRI
jgi:hypothetical protein